MVTRTGPGFAYRGAARFSVYPSGSRVGQAKRPKAANPGGPGFFSAGSAAVSVSCAPKTGRPVLASRTTPLNAGSPVGPGFLHGSGGNAGASRTEATIVSFTASPAGSWTGPGSAATSISVPPGVPVGPGFF